MKIIGKTNDGFILEASKDDIAGIQGMYCHQVKTDIGTIIDISGLFNKYANVSSAFNTIQKLRETADVILKAADWVEQFNKEK